MIEPSGSRSTFTLSEESSLFCHDLPSHPLTGMGKILVTGASGYIGGRLVPELLARGYKLRVMVRAPSPVYRDLWPDVEVVAADALDLEQLKTALEGIDTAYYLIHSLLLGHKKFATAEIRAAVNFRIAADGNRIRRIIYLGGLGDTQSNLSPHLRSRIQVAEELKKGIAPVTTLRAAIIIGSGSASYEIIQHLVKRLSFILIPRWAMTKCQPIGIRDVIKYLVGVLETPQTAGGSFDIGGKDILSYYEMLKIRAQLLNKKRYFIPFFSFMPLYSYIGGLITPIPAPITRSLMEGLKNEVICRNDTIRSYLPFEPLSYKEAIIRAMNREEQDRIHTRWSDAYPPAHELALKLVELKGGPRYTNAYFIDTPKDASSLFRCICTIGGKRGWFSNNWVWRLRGVVDNILMGVGTTRGRKSQTMLRVGDVIDYWRVEDLRKDTRLLLRAEMKLPGKAWLEFRIDDVGSKRRLSVIAHYQPRDVLGKVYWYAFLSCHRFLFRDLIKQIEARAD
ncbi:MAG: SDR family oxidoreductase [Deltaproteobacteria bacterium]|nr:SDR family oxidoreductase [Deltaproteobacteria bacterium]